MSEVVSDGIVIVVIGVGDCVCFSVVLMKVFVKNCSLLLVGIYVLLDIGLEVIFCYNEL